ncbi:hypothetical protein M378DRAFT_188714 [Amanita muscaria Koide BX008]|uniref:Uncharacterized protein n=1 Tax=Amanita muscaria (strain Koide BX008) TaxID=946122 RepID=A0A0C2SLM8_AMAMK|nr:hypothetical protein M378DRAFT_188714 [Amanita muscaria Koide BX008]
MHTESHYWHTIAKLGDAKTKAEHKSIVKSTGISRMPLTAASCAFLHPSFYPLDPFHLFFENIVPHIWDIWTIHSETDELGHLNREKAEKFGELVGKAMSTLPPSFCGAVRDPYLKRQSQYKAFEWMALTYWYIVPIGCELGFNSLILQNFASLAKIIETAMTISP